MRRSILPLKFKYRKNIKSKMLFSFLCLLFLTMGVGYSYLATNLTAMGTAKIEPPPATLRNWDYDSLTDFHRYKKSIVKASFVDYIDLTNAITLPNGTGVNYWDVSANQNESVLGWLELDSVDNTKYNLYIGTNNALLYANKDSSFIFYSFSNLKEIQFQNFDTSNVTNMKFMFFNCSSLTTLDLSSFDTSNVTEMRAMFSGCSSLMSLNVSSFDTSNVTIMGAMFYGCSSLTSLNVSSFNTSKVTSMMTMFAECSSLTSLDISNFNTSNVTNMVGMFQNCSSLTTLDLSSFDMSKVTDISTMLAGTDKVTTAYARTEVDAAILNDVDTNKPHYYSFVVKA